jgi:flavin-dependent dehydrogenase
MRLAWIRKIDRLPSVKNSIAIAGGGLAGLSLGIALQLRGVQVTIHEASAYPRHRVCGEFISGVSEETLRILGIACCLEKATILTSACWNDPAGKLAEMRAPGKGISRWSLDTLLQERFTKLGGTLITNSRVTPDQAAIWAAGRPRRPSSWLGLKCHARNLKLEADLEMFASPGGYVGISKIEDDKVNICGLFQRRRGGPARANSSKGIGLLLDTLRDCSLTALAGRLEDAELEESSFCGVAGFQSGLQEGPAFRIGDAASMIPPFTGNGMSMAFESAECALEPALQYARGRSSWTDAGRAAAATQTRRFARRMMAANLLHGLITNAAGLKLISALARGGFLPFQTLFHLVR